MILRRVKFRAVSYCAESCDFRIFFKGTSNEIVFPFLHNSSLPWPLSNGLKHFRFLYRFHRVIQVFWDWLRAVRYCAESVFSILRFEYLGENDTKFETILIHWPVTQAGSNDEKNYRGRKSHWTVPLSHNDPVTLQLAGSFQTRLSNSPDFTISMYVVHGNCNFCLRPGSLVQYTTLKEIYSLG